MPIVSHLGSKDPSLLGYSPLERSLVRQWITFQVDFPLFLIQGARVVKCLFSCLGKKSGLNIFIQFGCLDLADKRELWRHLRNVRDKTRHGN